MKSTLTAIALLATANVAAQAQIQAPEVLSTANLVANYFMDSYPDVGAKSYVGGKERDSKIWTRGVFYEGLLNLYSQNPTDRILNYCIDWGNFHQWYSCADNAARHADFQCCGQAYIEMYMMEPEQTQRIEHIKMRIDDMMATDKIDDWYWIDAIQMAMPIFAQLGTVTGNTNYYQRMYDMYMYTRNKHGGDKKGGGKPLFNESTGLWYRDYQFDPPYKDKVETDKDCYWSRGNGWVYLALARVMQYTPAEAYGRQQYIDDFVKMSQALYLRQRTDGYWNVSLDAPSNFGSKGSQGPEMTGTSLFVGGLAWGIRNGLLDAETYMPAVTRGWQAMHEAVHPNGFVGYLQGAGSKPEDGGPITYTSVPDFEDFGIGCFLWGAAEVYALVNGEPTSISDVRADPETTDMYWYDLTGRPTLHPAPGHVYIHNHRVIVR